MKKIVCSFTLITLLTISFLGSYSFDVPVYADSVPEGYSPAGVNDQVDAFKAYCKSRNLTIEGSMLDAVTSFTSSTYNKICSVLGIDINELQNQIYKGVGANAGKWYFTNSGIGAMNRIFAEFLQNNNLSEGDTNVNDTVFDGDMFTGGENNEINGLVFILPGTSGTAQAGVTEGFKVGNYIEPYGNDMVVGTSINIPISDVHQQVKALNNQSLNVSRDGTVSKSTINGFSGIFLTTNASASNPNKAAAYCPYASNGTRGVYGGLGIAYVPSRNQYYIVKITSDTLFTDIYYWDYYDDILENTGTIIEDVTINIKSTKINNNTYEGDTIINNDGDHIVNKTYEYNYPIENPTPVPTPSPITWPTIDLPDLNIDFRIDGISDKFPFSIPKDLVSFYTLLNTEAQAPSIDRTIPLGFYDWHFEADFSQFEDYAEIVRKVEFIGFVVGLIYITIRLVKG